MKVSFVFKETNRTYAFSRLGVFRGALVSSTNGVVNVMTTLIEQFHIKCPKSIFLFSTTPTVRTSTTPSTASR